MGYFDVIGDLASSAADTVSSTVDSVEDTASSAYHAVEDQAVSTCDTVAEDVGLPNHAAVQETFSHYADEGEELVGDAYHAEQEFADDQVKGVKWVAGEIDEGVDAIEADAHETAGDIREAT